MNTRICVYFLQSENGGPVKIGKATSNYHVKKRLESCQIGNPETLQIVAIAEWCRHDFEKTVHNFYKDKRIRGEWFENSILQNLKDDLEWLNNLRRYASEENWVKIFIENQQPANA
jgi:DNA repair exonuclease SbcCD nuclease subunit